MMPMSQSMMPFFLQMMSQGSGGMGGPSGVPQAQNAAPQINVSNLRAGGGGGGMPPSPPPQQPQQPGFIQNMMSSPTQMTNGMSMMNKAGNGISSAYDWLGGPGSAGGAGTPVYNSIMGAGSGLEAAGTAGMAAAPMAPIAAAPMASALAPAAGAAGAAGAAAGASSMPAWLTALFAL